jgi:hypothetical protein
MLLFVAESAVAAIVGIGVRIFRKILQWRYYYIGRGQKAHNEAVSSSSSQWKKIDGGSTAQDSSEC